MPAALVLGLPIVQVLLPVHLLIRLGEDLLNIHPALLADGDAHGDVAAAGREVGISQAQVSRLEKAALQTMRKYI